MTYPDFIKEWRGSADHIRVHTSGSTGIPKEINLSKEFLIESATRTNNFFGINSLSHLHSCISPDFIGGKMMAVRAEVAGAKFTWEDPSNFPLKNTEAVENIDLMAVVPSQMQDLLERIPSLPNIKNIIIGGSAIHPMLRKKIAKSCLNAYETYGMTETASHIALRKVCIGSLPFECLPGITVSTEENGVLKISFQSGYEVVTNDLANVLTPNSFNILGRNDNIIISGGKKINPFEIEEKIAGLLNQRFYVTSVEDEKWGEKVVLMVEGEATRENEDKLKNGMKSLLEPWQVPKTIYYTKRFRTTPSGKLLRDRPHQLFPQAGF